MPHAKQAKPKRNYFAYIRASNAYGNGILRQQQPQHQQVHEPNANGNSIAKERTEEQAKAHVLQVINRWQYVNMAQLINHVKAAYLDLYSSDLDKLVQELVSEGRAFKQGNQYYVKK